MNQKTLGKLAIGVALGAAALLAYRAFGWDRLGPVSGLRLDLSRPDALIVTRSLSALPRDLLAIPLARDVLREDFLFYYEQNADRLGLRGSLRRIAYEHELGWGDQLIRMVLDQPAEVALWRDADGSLQHFAIAVSRGNLARVVGEAAKVALKDSQMTLAGSLAVDGERVPVYALDYAHGRTLLLAARGKRLLVLSHPGMLYGGADGRREDPAARDVLAGLLSADQERQRQFARQFHLEPGAAGVAGGHSVAVKASFLSFGYQPFFGALSALRFDFDHGRWRSRALIDASLLPAGGYDGAALWPALPHNPAACFVLPANWAATRPVLERLGRGGEAALAPLSLQLSGPAAVCWYANSRLYTPVLVASAKPGAVDTALFERLFTAALGRPGEAAPGMRDAGSGVVQWQSNFEPSRLALSARLAVSGRNVVFSLDGALVEKVLAVIGKRAPAAADQMTEPGRTIGLVAPAALAELIRKEAFDALPAAEEPVLRGAADAHLVPRLSALKSYPSFRMVLRTAPDAGAGIAWQALEWQAVQP